MTTSRASRTSRLARGAAAVAALAAVATTAACGGGEPTASPSPEATSTTAIAPSGPTTTPGPTTPTAGPTTTGPSTATPRPERTVEIGPDGPGPDGAEITLPPAGVEADGPVVVLVHGGAWRIGSPGLMQGWASALAAEGAVVVNASYRLVDLGAGVLGDPASVDDVACAVRYARAEASQHTSSDELVLVGHSAGGHLGAVVALDPDPYGADCPYPAGRPVDRFVGLAGIYDVRAFPLSLVFAGFVGASTEEAPQRWAALNPVELADLRDDLAVTLVTGGNDTAVPATQATAFEAALPGGATAVVVPGAGHNALQDPSVVGVDVVLGGS